MSDVLPRLTKALQSSYRVSREIGVGEIPADYLAHDLRHVRFDNGDQVHAWSLFH